MTESDARAVLLLRTFEDPPRPPWSDADALAADRAARLSGGESASFENWIAARARWAGARLAQREPAAAALVRASGWPAWLGATLVLLAFAAGVASDAIGATHRINLLAPPLLALLVWNGAVYAFLIGHRLWPQDRTAREGPLRGALLGLMAGGHPLRRMPREATTAAVFLREWARQAGPLYGARSALILHTAAAALVLGALCSMYARGLVLEYRAGWDSTFLQPADVRSVLAGVLGPASSLSGIPLPDAAHLATIRFSAGPGENAAPWIHLYAITLALGVLVPRAVLGLAAALRARSVATRFPLQLDDAYFLRLRRRWSGAPIEVRVLPYSYRPGHAVHDALRQALERHLGGRVEPTIADPLPLGAEDDLARWIGAAPALVPGQAAAAQVALLFAATTTPEREHHGALVRAVAARAGGEPMIVLVDESGFRRRFPGADFAGRLEERRQAWRALLDEDAVTPLFVDLGAGEADGDDTARAPMPPPPRR